MGENHLRFSFYDNCSPSIASTSYFPTKNNKFDTQNNFKLLTNVKTNPHSQSTFNKNFKKFELFGANQQTLSRNHIIYKFNKRNFSDSSTCSVETASINSTTSSAFSNRTSSNSSVIGNIACRVPQINASHTTLKADQYSNNSGLSDEVIDYSLTRLIINNNLSRSCRKNLTIVNERKNGSIIREYDTKDANDKEKINKKNFQLIRCSILSLFIVIFAIASIIFSYFILRASTNDEGLLNAFKKHDNAFIELLYNAGNFVEKMFAWRLNISSTIHGKNQQAFSPFEMYLSENKTESMERRRALMNLFEAKYIRKNLNEIASNVHVSGTREQYLLMDMLEQRYKELNYDVHAYEYDVLLSYPNYDRPNKIHAYNSTSYNWDELSSGLSQIIGKGNVAEQQQDDPRSLVWWNAYSANGTVIAPIVYVNYGTREDYDNLRKLGITVQDKIVLARYGSLFRGEKVYLAQKNGAVGVIFYCDPYDFAPDENVFPDAVWLPSTGAQRGTLLRFEGDPETPGLPSKSYVHRSESIDHLRFMNTIPNISVTSISYGDALKIFQRMDKEIAPWAEWHGSLNTIYRVASSTNFRLEVQSIEKRRRIKNFLACIYGSEHPDEWILLGNHADAWVKGAIDPGTGTAIMLETARVIKSYADMSNWKPRRTICFCQWDAEEFGLIGSTEWVEEYIRLIENRAVAYINVDHISGNNTLDLKATPLLYRILVNSASEVPHPLSFNKNSEFIGTSLLDAWRFYSPKGPLPGDRTVPSIQPPVGGSDFQAFSGLAGIASADLRLQSAPRYSFMLYHSMYEIPWTVEEFIDPHYDACVAIGRMWLEVGRCLADSLIIPFNVEDYGIVLEESLQRLDAQLKRLKVDAALGPEIYENKIKFLNDAVNRFQKVAVIFQFYIHEIDIGTRKPTLKQVQMLNSRLRALERCFILDRDASKRPADRHALFSVEINGDGMPMGAILRPVLKWVDEKGKENTDRHLESILRGFSHLQFSIESATHTLKLNGF